MGFLSSAYLKRYKAILRLGLPLLIGQLGAIAVSFADNMMVGHYSTAALASASFVNNFFNIAVLACIGFANGFTPLIGAMFARGDSGGIGAAVRWGLIVNVVFTVAVSAVMLFLYFRIDIFGQPAELIPIIEPYYIMVLAGMLPVSIFALMSQWAFGIGNTVMPTVIVLAANGLNVLGNYILIFGHWGAPELGLLGAGISTFTARVLCLAAILIVFFGRGCYAPYRRGFRSASRSEGLVTGIFRTGFPVSMQMTFETAAFSGAAIFAGWIGEISLAALQIAIISGMLGFCIYYSINGAMSIDVSHAAGHNDRALMRRSAWAGYHITLVAMLIACAIFFFGGETLFALFSDDPEVVALAVTLIVPMVIYQLGDATQITFANALRGTSKVMPMLYIAFFCYVVVGLPSTYVFAFTFGLETYGIVLSFSVSLFLAAALFLFFFLRATRKLPENNHNTGKVGIASVK